MTLDPDLPVAVHQHIADGSVSQEALDGTETDECVHRGFHRVDSRERCCVIEQGETRIGQGRALERHVALEESAGETIGQGHGISQTCRHARIQRHGPGVAPPAKARTVAGPGRGSTIPGPGGSMRHNVRW